MNKYEEALHSIKSKLDRSKHDVAVYEQKLVELKHQSLLAEYEDKYVILATFTNSDYYKTLAKQKVIIDETLEVYYSRENAKNYYYDVVTRIGTLEILNSYVFTKEQVDQFVKDFPRPKLARSGVIPFKDSQLVSQLLYLADKEENK